MNREELIKYLTEEIKQSRKIEKNFVHIEHIYWHFFGQRIMAEKILKIIEE